MRLFVNNLAEVTAVSDVVLDLVGVSQLGAINAVMIISMVLINILVLILE